MPPSHPHLLTPYLSPPQYSLTILTSVLGATSNWLVIRYLYAALSPAPKDAEGGIGAVQGKKKVVLVSFMRGWAFWRAEARRLGLDLNRLANENRLSFVDGISELFPVGEPSQPSQATRSPAANAPSRQGNARPTTMQWKDNEGLNGIEKHIEAAINDLKTHDTESESTDEDVLLVIDQPDLLLAATGQQAGVGATQMESWIMGLRSHVHSTIVTLSADFPLVHNTSLGEPHPQTPLEQAHSSFLIWMAHQATLVMQLRGLDTGVAVDVSGVLRMSRGGSASDALIGNGEVHQWEENEYLYFVQGDGGVRVFGRGE